MHLGNHGVRSSEGECALLHCLSWHPSMVHMRVLKRMHSARRCPSSPQRKHVNRTCVGSYPARSITTRIVTFSGGEGQCHIIPFRLSKIFVPFKRPASRGRNTIFFSADGGEKDKRSEMQRRCCCECSGWTILAANAAFTYAIASIAYVIVTRCMGTPFSNSLSARQRNIKSASARARGIVIAGGLTLGVAVVAICRPFRT